MRDGQADGTHPSVSAQKGYASWSDSGPMVLGRTDGVDGAHVGGSRRGSETRPVASFTAQGLLSISQPMGRSVNPL